MPLLTATFSLHTLCAGQSKTGTVNLLTFAYLNYLFPPKNYQKRKYYL